MVDRKPQNAPTRLPSLLARNIRIVRLREALSRTELAIRADVSVFDLRAIERGQREAMHSEINRLAAALKIEPVILVTSSSIAASDVCAIFSERRNRQTQYKN